VVGERLDLTEDPEGSGQPRLNSGNRRPYVGVHFVCCDTYARVYVNRGKTAYEGHCPKCAKKVRIRIGPGGTEARFFTSG
jgi:hypothetical protein